MGVKGKLRLRTLVLLGIPAALVVATAGFVFRPSGEEGLPPRLVAFALSPSRVQLSWTAEDHDARYRVLRNGDVISDTRRTVFTDSDVRTDVPYRYRVLTLDPSGRVSGSLSAGAVTPPSKRSFPVYPLKGEPGRRYLVDQRNVPFMVVGDSPQALTVNLAVVDAETFLADRRAAGYNAMWVNLLCIICTSLAGGRADGTTYDGISPFIVPGDLSTPNDAYFRRVDQMIGVARKYGIVLFLNPIETAGWLEILRQNGVEKSYGYGRYLGARYGRFANIVWFHGNDFQTWRNRSDSELVQAVARGIRAGADRARQPHTVELNYEVSSSLDDPSWRPLIGVDAVYTYGPTYAELLKEYNRRHYLPTVMIEANYEFEAWHYPVDLETLRRQEYWAMLSGASGQFYGNKYTWQFSKGWQSHLDTPGSRQMGYAARFFREHEWFRLVPDQEHETVTTGYGEFATSGALNENDYATAARTPDGRLVIAYVPDIRPVTVDMTRLSGPAEARWYDPTRGKFTPVRGSPLPNAGTRQFVPPGENADGDGDWVLVLSAR